MNKRIREFERQSGIEIYGLGKDRAKWEASLAKFAELIVRECAIVCETVGDVAEAIGEGEPARYGKETAHGCAGTIKDMFGVE